MRGRYAQLAKKTMGRHRSIDDRELLDVARRLFREGGQSVSTREVARAAGVSQAVLFQRFPSKKELFFTAMSPDPPDVQAILGRAGGVTNVKRYLEGVASRMLVYFAESAPVVLQLMAHPDFDGKVMGKIHEHILLEQLGHGLAERLQAFRAQGLTGDVDAHAVAETFMAALHSFVVFHALNGADIGAEGKRTAARLVSVIWQGLAPRAGA